MSTRVIGPLALAVTVLFSSTATARLPEFSDTRITPKSMGGAKLGMTYKQVVARWGRGGIDEETEKACGGPESHPAEWTCTWKSTAKPRAWVRFELGKADGIGIAGPRKSRPGRLRTHDGHGLGTPGEKLFMSSCQSNSGATSVHYWCSGITFEVNRTGKAVSVTIG